jgi:IS4 transposase
LNSESCFFYHAVQTCKFWILQQFSTSTLLLRQPVDLLRYLTQFLLGNYLVLRRILLLLSNSSIHIMQPPWTVAAMCNSK